MRITFDPAKDLANRTKHGVPLAAADALDWDSALIWIDDRFDYGEIREIAMGPIAGRLHVLVYTRRGETIRAISLRRALYR